MSSILKSDINRSITGKALKEAGFEKIVWGAPEFVWGPEKKSTSKRAPKHELKLKWNPGHKCWSREFVGTEDSGAIFFFPKRFTGYVTRWHGAPPANTVFVLPNNMDDEVYECAVNTTFDLDVLMSNIKKTYGIYDDEDDD
jgi:hypothetical protein